MSTFIWVAVGGAVGSAARYGLAGVVNYRSHPWGTVTVNVLGALILGALVGLWGFRADSAVRVGVAVGLLGGFTTFSTFAIDAVYLWEQGHQTAAITSILITLVVGIGAAIAGVVIGRTLAG